MLERVEGIIYNLLVQRTVLERGRAAFRLYYLFRIPNMELHAIGFNTEVVCWLLVEVADVFSLFFDAYDGRRLLKRPRLSLIIARTTRISKIQVTSSLLRHVLQDFVSFVL